MLTHNVTIKETLKIALGEIVVLAILFLVFLAAGHFDRSVVFGGLLGAGANLLYFFIICIGVNCAMHEDDKKRQKLSLSISYYLRFLVLGVLVAVGLKLDCFNDIAVVIPVLMTRPILTVAEIIGKGVKE